MGVLLKLILFGLVFYFLIKTVGALIGRALGGQQAAQAQRRSTQQPRQREGEINIDYVPNKEKDRKRPSNSDGDYIDYEEVK
jgi:hypothetical protein